VKTKTSGTMAALLTPDLKIALQIRWATRLAAARNMDLIIFQRIEGREDRVVEIPLDQPPGNRSKGRIRQLIDIIGDTPELYAGSRERAETAEKATDSASQMIHVRLRQIHFRNLRSLRQALLAEIGSKKVKLFTLAREHLVEMNDADLVTERRLFLRYIPCEVVLCQGIKEDTDFSRVLVAATGGPHAKASLELGLCLTTREKGTMTALYVNPDVGKMSEQVGKRRLDRLLRKLFGGKPPAMDRRVMVDNQVKRGVRKVWDEGKYDLLVVGAPLNQIEGNIGTRLKKDMTVVFVSSASPFSSGLKMILEGYVQRYVPQIQREDRIALVDRVQSSAAWNFDFVTLMVLSTIMAAIGLLQNSAAVVIGAMLVAPLMTPLLGLGLAFVQGNAVLARVSIRSVILGLCVSLLGGFLVGFCTLNLEEPTREMLSRGGPGLLDLFVAFAAGLAAAYASSRPGLIAALPGVAIAAALVPPIATSGLALSLGDFPLAIGALLLFGINMVTIVLAAMTSLWAVGIRNLKKTFPWSRMAVSVVMVAVLVLGVYLSLQNKEYELTQKMPEGLVEALQESLGSEYRFDGLSVAYDELGVQLRVSVIGRNPAPEELATEVRTAASDLYKQPVRVRLLTQIEVGDVVGKDSRKAKEIKIKPVPKK
jgi:uncharacterized hydrophobic protein (TIGR00271 family)